MKEANIDYWLKIKINKKIIESIQTNALFDY